MFDINSLNENYESNNIFDDENNDNLRINNPFLDQMLISNLPLSTMDSFNFSFFPNDTDYSKESYNPLLINNLNLENKINNEKSTNDSTQKNLKELPNFISIFQILDKIDDVEIRKKIKDGEIEKTNEYKYMESLNKKWKKNEKVYKYHYFDQNIGKKKRGRKPKPNHPIIEHDKMSADNVIKKIKSILIKKVLEFFNQLFRHLTKNIQLLKLDYKYSNQLKRTVEFNLFKKKLEDLISLNISPKYVKFEKSYNKEIIRKIKNKEENIIDETNEKAYHTLMFVFNLTFYEWLDLIRGNKNFEDLDNYYEHSGFIDLDLLKNNFVGINQILNNLKGDEKYLAKFTFYLYNYERWFYLKTARNLTEKKKNTI